MMRATLARGLDARERAVARAVEAQRDAADVHFEASVSGRGGVYCCQRAGVDECAVRLCTQRLGGH